MRKLSSALLLCSWLAPNISSAQSLINRMHQLVITGTECKQDFNGWLNCKYEIGKKLKISIKDAGGSDQVIAFNHSDINDDFAAVMYFGCIVVIPGHATKNHGIDDNVYISPKNGRVYLTKNECQTAK